jgi:hypothetical protein
MDRGEDAIVDGDVDSGEVGGERAGRIVEPDEGVRGDTEEGLVGTDVGIDGAAARRTGTRGGSGHLGCGGAAGPQRRLRRAEAGPR